MKMVLLLRHAKSAWSQPGLDDHERPLNRRGERAAEAMADHIVRNVPRPDLILCSTTVRTRQTLAPLVHRLTVPAPPIALERGLYLASADVLLERLRAITEEVGTVLLIGHNEGIGELADPLRVRLHATTQPHRRAPAVSAQPSTHPSTPSGVGRSVRQ